MNVLLLVLMPFSAFSCHSKFGHFRILGADGKYDIVSAKFI